MTPQFIFKQGCMVALADLGVDLRVDDSCLRSGDEQEIERAIAVDLDLHYDAMVDVPEVRAGLRAAGGSGDQTQNQSNNVVGFHGIPRIAI